MPAFSYLQTNIVRTDLDGPADFGPEPIVVQIELSLEQPENVRLVLGV